MKNKKKEEFPKLDGGYCDGLGCSKEKEECFCDAWLKSREEFQRQYNQAFVHSWEEGSTIEMKVWEDAWRWSWEKYINAKRKAREKIEKEKREELYAKYQKDIRDRRNETNNCK